MSSKKPAASKRANLPRASDYTREFLKVQHPGITPGDKIDLDLLPDGRAVLNAARPAGTIAGFVGLLAGRTDKIATLEEIDAVAAQGWSGRP